VTLRVQVYDGESITPMEAPEALDRLNELFAQGARLKSREWAKKRKPGQPLYMETPDGATQLAITDERVS
jgi:hypothetical protein